MAMEELPALAQQASVLIMPYADLPVTRVMQPLKLKEYLATGRPVVAAPLRRCWNGKRLWRLRKRRSGLRRGCWRIWPVGGSP